MIPEFITSFESLAVGIGAILVGIATIISARRDRD